MTGRFNSGSPPKNVSAKLFGLTASRRASVHSAVRAARVHRHLRGGLVVLAVIALQAVVAREVALQRRQHRDAELVLASRETR